MRELVFDLEYDPGCNAVADTLADHPDASIRSLSLHATETSLWRVDHATGSPEALDALEDAFLTADYYADCLVTEDCGATQTTQVLEHTDDTLVLYSFWKRTPTCSSVPHVALDHLGEGALFETRHEQRRYTWRIIHSGDGDVGAFFDELDAAVGDSARMEMLRSTDVASSSDDAFANADDLPPNQREALRAAVEHGYYETPREVDAARLADELDVARSTLTYRLRRAEAHLVKQYLERGQMAEGRPSAL